MEKWLSMLMRFSVLFFAGVLADSEEDVGSLVKGRLARMLLAKEESNTGSKNITVTWEPTSSDIHFNGGRSAIFRTFNTNYFYHTNSLYELHLQPAVPSKPFYLGPQMEMLHPAQPGVMEMANWRNILYVASCYFDHCEISTASGGSDLTHRQSISTSSMPVQLRFFEQNDFLFMVIASDMTSIYQWTDTYFDEVERLDTPSLRSLEIFTAEEQVVIVATQSREKKALSKVFVRNKDKTKLTQLLDADKLEQAVHYQLDTINGRQHYLLLLSRSSQSLTYWWNGKKFSTWSKIENIEEPEKAYTGIVGSEPFIFIISKNSVFMYHIKTTELTFVTTIKAEDSIIDSMTVEDPNIVLLVDRSLSGRQIVVVSLRVRDVPVPESFTEYSAVECMKALLKKVKTRGKLLDNLNEKQKNIFSNTRSIHAKKISTKGTTVFNDAKIKRLVVDPNGVKLMATPKEIKENLTKIHESFLMAKNKIDETRSMRKRIIVNGELYVKTLKANKLTIENLNNRPLDLDDFMSLSKDQTFEGPIKAAVIEVVTINADHLNGHSPKDLLQKKAKDQVFSGELSTSSIFANNIRFGEISKINGIPFDKFATSENQVVSGKKTFTELNVETLNVSMINSEPSKKWLKKVLPTISVNDGDESFVTNTMKVKNLTVENINNLSWDSFLSLMEQKHAFNGTFRAKNLITKLINNIPVEDFLTRDSDQNVTSNIQVPYMLADNLAFGTFNNATREQVAEALKKVIRQGNGVREVTFEGPVEVEGDFNVTSIHFKQPVLLPNNTVGFANADQQRLIIESNSPSAVTSEEIAMLQEERFIDERNSQSDAKSVHVEKNVEKKRKIVIHGNVKVRDKIKVATINGFDVASTLNNIVLLDDDSVLDHVTFKSLIVENLAVASINDVPMLKEGRSSVVVNGSLIIPEIIVVCGEKETISSCKRSLQKLTVKGNLDGVINNVDLNAFSRTTLSKSKNQEITGSYTFATLNTNKLNVSSINNLKMDQLLYVDDHTTQTVYSDLVFENIGALGNLNVSSLLKCELNKLANINMSEVEHLESLEVVGNVNWAKSRMESKSLSYLFENLVTRSGHQLITAPVVFNKNVTMEKLNTTTHINGVDLGFISQDAVMSSALTQEIKTESAFKSTLTATDVMIKDNISVDSIDGVDILSFNASLVRKDEDKIVTGLKVMKGGIVAHSLRVEKVHGINSSNLVFVEHFLDNTFSRVLPPTTFNSLTVLSNLNVTKVNDTPLDPFLESLISLSENGTFPQKVKFTANLKIDHLKAAVVNDLKMDDTILIDGDDKTLTGNVEFLDTVRAVDVDAKTVYGVDLKQCYEKSIKIDENATIFGNLIFEDTIIVKGNINIANVNECPMSQVYEKEKSYNPKYIISENNKAALLEMQKIEEVIKSKPNNKILKYLEHNTTLNFEMENIKSTSVVKTKSGVTDVHIYGMARDSCRLPMENCLCPRQYTASFDSQKIVTSYKTNRTFDYYSASHKIFVQVFTNSVSYSSRCKVEGELLDEVTQIQWAIGNSNLQGDKVLRSGYLSDVKFFKLGDSVFIALAFLFSDNVTDSNGPKVTVFELQTPSGTLFEVDSLPAQGAMTLDVLWASPSYILVIGNIRSEDTPLDSVHSEVYRFNERLNKFEFLKRFRTHGVLSLKAIRIKKESFIFIAQKYPWPLLAFKYSHELGNYYFSEKLVHKAGFYSVSAIPTAEQSFDDVYVGVVYMNDFFTIFKYKHIEGLVEETTVKQKNVQALQNLFLEREQYLLAVSPAGSSNVYRVVTQG